ncbi:MAG TPA: tetratricopeptide repeat protein [Spirochaetota bacterium]|nr:tetratricopeptide repeat protein [Spirochaetota bacterium]
MAQYNVTLEEEKIKELLIHDHGLKALVEAVVNQVLEEQVTEKIGAEKYDYRDITEVRGMLIEKGDNVWIPVEVTLAGEQFMRAWQEGARQYTKTVANNQDIGIYPSAEAWQEFVPVTLEEWGWEPDVPQKGQIADLYDKDIKLLIGTELDGKVREIKDQIAREPKNAKLYNALGITYGRYGKYDDAIKSLEKAIGLDGRYASAYNNLGNVHYLLGRYEEALSYYMKALDYNKSPLILINIAKTIHKMGATRRPRPIISLQ